jgi:glycerophosphoryl diester phosphodiesterase
MDLARPLVFAHRGASAYAPENTLAAFELAIQQGAPAIELDAKLSADGYVVVIHDQTVDRTTKNTGRVAELSLAELRQMDAGSHFDVSFQGEKIPTLADVFASIGQRALINVELTNYASPRDDLPEKVAELVRQHRMISNVLFSSFNPIALARIHRLLPQAPIGLLALSGPAGAWARSGLGRLFFRLFIHQSSSHYQTLHPDWRDVTLRLVDQTHRHNRKVFPYTLNQEEAMLRLLDLGVDGFFSDDPPLALSVLKNRQLRSGEHTPNSPATSSEGKASPR